jgi:Uma2 family endonuclease
MSRGITKANKQPEPTWAIAELFPPQGHWSEEEYLALDTNRIVELSDGCLEVPPLPTTSHQLILAYLFGLLQTFVNDQDLGIVLLAALPMRLRRGKYREPDILFMAKEHADRIHEEYWERADLVMEIVSKDRKDRKRDLVEKRAEYARAKLPEYWIIDPAKGKITVLWLSGKRYAVHGEFSGGDTASSRLLPGFSIDVTAAFASAAAVPGKSKSRRNSRRRNGGD